MHQPCGAVGPLPGSNAALDDGRGDGEKEVRIRKKTEMKLLHGRGYEVIIMLQ